MYGVDGRDLSGQYKHHISNYHSWGQLPADYYVLFKGNLGEQLSMDETCLSQGELYTLLTNKSAHGGKGSLIAMIKGTKSQDVLHYLNQLPCSLRLKVKEITIDLSPTMKIIAKQAFPNATIVSDHGHVQKLMKLSPICVLIIAGRLLIWRMPRWSSLVKLGVSLCLTRLKMGIHAGSCLLVVDIS